MKTWKEREGEKGSKEEEKGMEKCGGETRKGRKKERE